MVVEKRKDWIGYQSCKQHVLVGFSKFSIFQLSHVGYVAISWHISFRHIL